MFVFKTIPFFAVAVSIGVISTNAAIAEDGLGLRGTSDTQVVSQSPIDFDWIQRPTFVDNTITGSLVGAEPNNLVKSSDLRGFVSKSLLESDALRATKHDAFAAREASREARFALLPDLSFSADFGSTNEPITIGGSREQHSTFTNSLTANWRIFNSGTGIATIRAADFQALASSANYLASERRELMESLGIYLQIYAGQHLVSSLNNTIKNLGSIRHSISKQFEAGLASRTDIAQVDAEISAMEVQIETAKRQLAQQKIAWKSKIGTPLAKKLAKPRTSALLGGNRKSILQRALRGNSIIASAQYSALSAVEKSKSDMASFLPGVSVYVSAVNRGSTPSFSNSDFEWKAGIKLTVPLINLKGTSKYRQSKQAAHAAKYRALDTEREIAKEIETNWESVESYRKSVAILKRKIAANKKVVTGVRKELQAGLKSVEDILREEINLAASKIELLQNEVNEIAAAYRIAIHFSDLTLADIVTQ